MMYFSEILSKYIIMQWIWMPEVVIVNLRKRTGKRRETP